MRETLAELCSARMWAELAALAAIIFAFAIIFF
jgi:hypothetical protein